MNKLSAYVKILHAKTAKNVKYAGHTPEKLLLKIPGMEF